MGSVAGALVVGRLLAGLAIHCQSKRPKESLGPEQSAYRSTLTIDDWHNWLL